MNSGTIGLVLAFAWCLVPLLAGIGGTLVIQHRMKKLGWWGLIPAGGLIKALWEGFNR